MSTRLQDLPIDILDHIMAACTAPTLDRFHATCKDADRLVVREMERRVNLILSPYVANVPRLLQRLDQCAGCISSSAGALAAAPERAFSINNVDIFISVFTSPVIVELLVNDEHYTVINSSSRRTRRASSTADDNDPNAPPAPAADAAPAPDLNAPLVFAHTVPGYTIVDADTPDPDDVSDDGSQSDTSSRDDSDGDDDDDDDGADAREVCAGGILKVIHLQRGNRFINIVQSRSIIATLPITCFHSTAPMVIITGQAICISYPRLAEKDQALINPGRIPEEPRPEYPQAHNRRLLHLKARYDTHLDKYEGRGYDLCHNALEWVKPLDPTAACDALDDPHCPLTVRWLGDPHCLTFALGSTIEERLMLPPPGGALAPFTTLWWRGGEPCGGECTTTDDVVPTVSHVIPLNMLQ